MIADIARDRRDRKIVSFTADLRGCARIRKNQKLNHNGHEGTQRRSEETAKIAIAKIEKAEPNVPVELPDATW